MRVFLHQKSMDFIGLTKKSGVCFSTILVRALTAEQVVSKKSNSFLSDDVAEF